MVVVEQQRVHVEMIAALDGLLEHGQAVVGVLQIGQVEHVRLAVGRVGARTLVVEKIVAGRARPLHSFLLFCSLCSNASFFPTCLLFFFFFFFFSSCAFLQEEEVKSQVALFLNICLADIQVMRD